MSSRPLLPQQERFRELASDEKKFPAAHIALAFEIKGSLRPGLLEQAFRSVYEKTDLPHFRFSLSRGEQWQDISSLAVAFLFRQVRAAEVKSFLKSEYESKFDLEKDAPLRLTLLEVSPQKHVLGIVAHHLAIDGWSLARLLEKSCLAYNALARNEVAPALPWQPYWGYLEEYERQLALPASGKSREFWRTRRFTAEPLLSSYEANTPGHRVIYILNKKYYQKVKALAKANKVTPFLFLLTCFSRSLGKVLKREKLQITVPIASRDWDKAEFVVGNCVNLLPLEVALDPAFDLLADLANVKKTYLDSIGHSLTPFAEIQRQQALDLAQLHFNFEPSVEEPEIEGCEIDFFPYPVSQVERPIIINVNDTKKTYYIEIDYQFQCLDLVQALTLFTEAERIINKIEAAGIAAP